MGCVYYQFSPFINPLFSTVKFTLLIYARFFKSKLLANEAYHKVNIIPNFVLPYDAERGTIPLIKHHHLIEVPLSFYFVLARRYDFQDVSQQM